MLQLEHVTYRVKDDQGEKTILNDVNLSLSERFVAFTGPNGGGKSTLAKVIAAILPEPINPILYIFFTLLFIYTLMLNYKNML